MEVHWYRGSVGEVKRLLRSAFTSHCVTARRAEGAVGTAESYAQLPSLRPNQSNDASRAALAVRIIIAIESLIIFCHRKLSSSLSLIPLFQFDSDRRLNQINVKLQTLL